MIILSFCLGIPRNAYGQSYYTLRSVFLDGVPPPKIHVHLKLFHVESEIPLGDVDVYQEKAPSESRKEDEISRVESARFEEWVLELWRKKDAMIEMFLVQRAFSPESTGSPGFTFPLQLRSNWEILHSWCLFGPGLVAFLLKQVYHIVFGGSR